MVKCSQVCKVAHRVAVKERVNTDLIVKGNSLRRAAAVEILIDIMNLYPVILETGILEVRHCLHIPPAYPSAYLRDTPLKVLGVDIIVAGKSAAKAQFAVAGVDRKRELRFPGKLLGSRRKSKVKRDKHLSGCRQVANPVNNGLGERNPHGHTEIITRHASQGIS